MNSTYLPKRWNLCGAAFAGALLLSLSALTATAQVKLSIDRRVRVHETPSLAGKRIDGLAPGSKVTLATGRRGEFFRVQLENNKTGWVHGKYLLLPDLDERPLGAESLMTAAAGAAFPLCGPEAHYRWKQKISKSGFTQQPGKPSVNAALQWTPLSFSGHDLLSWCTARAGRETKVFSVLGWVRRTRKEDDGDVHIEITQNASDPVTDCFVVEIPAAELSPKFAQARTDLAALLSVNQLTDKDYTTPAHVRFTGLAFWDGWHATSDLPSKHGRCNSTKGAAWELHPVFKVSGP